MILNGHIDDRNQLWVDITVSGQHTEQKIAVLVDTGFTGDLQLPLIVAVPLGLKLVGVGTVELADGSQPRQMLFDATIAWGSKKKRVTVSVTDSGTPLLGGGLLHGYGLHVDFEDKTLIIQEPKGGPRKLRKSPRSGKNPKRARE